MTTMDHECTQLQEQSGIAKAAMSRLWPNSVGGSHNINYRHALDDAQWTRWLNMPI